MKSSSSTVMYIGENEGESVQYCIQCLYQRHHCDHHPLPGNESTPQTTLANRSACCCCCWYKLVSTKDLLPTYFFLSSLSPSLAHIINYVLLGILLTSDLSYTVSILSFWLACLLSVSKVPFNSLLQIALLFCSTWANQCIRKFSRRTISVHSSHFQKGK